MRNKLKLLIFMVLLSVWSVAQDTIHYKVNFLKKDYDLTKEEIRFTQRLKDSNQVELWFGARFNDSTQIFCFEKEIYNGILKTNYSVSMVNNSFLIDRKSNEIIIIFSKCDILSVPVLPDFNYIFIEHKHDEYIVNYLYYLNLNAKS